MYNPIVSIEENDNGFLVRMDKGSYGWSLTFSLEELEAFNNSISDFLHNKTLSGLGDFSLDDNDDCLGCKI